jgi:hypothetical protein
MGLEVTAHGKIKMICHAQKSFFGEKFFVCRQQKKILVIGFFSLRQDFIFFPLISRSFFTFNKNLTKNFLPLI